MSREEILDHIELYLAWVAAQPFGAPTSPSEYGEYLANAEAREVAKELGQLVRDE